MANYSYSDVFPQTLYHEARGEGETGIEWVAWVIRNRAAKDKSYWGGSQIDNVCRHPGQFECWDGRPTPIKEPNQLKQCQDIARKVIKKDASADPTGGADHYNNPDKERKPNWINKCDPLKKVGNHQFYKTKKEFS
jgi:N-acetylmuramoyl-L-alanine amidase